ncbi:GntR family transcriptional regulator [Devosia sp. MC532]|uniref:GntR family transcriptional regulator n=1 Tax=Devosia sp. MC532 TaxID=2799788 RepID=UPI0018F45E86|nr:GntR family transcriptional regulator [Devosia sp. MC532]MBJ7576826.1 GntR family transcriptional regulator [Devosia sp. MC532]
MNEEKPDEPTKLTAASQIALELRQEILQGSLPPGSRLRIEVLRQRFSTAINPVREALNRLVAEGLVDLQDHKGFSVSQVSLEVWRDLLEARCILEVEALRRSIANGTEEWRDEIVVSLHRLTRTPRFLDDARKVRNDKWEVYHHRFHRALVSCCGSDKIMAICDDLREQSDRYRAVAASSHKPRTDYDDEHKAIAEAAMAGNGDEAAGLLERHYRKTLKVIEQYFSEQH